jgi:hypothetical protein
MPEKRTRDWKPNEERETGELIVYFHIGSDGIAQKPFVVEMTTKEFPRLIEATQKILHGTRYESGEHTFCAIAASTGMRGRCSRASTNCGVRVRQACRNHRRALTAAA